MPRLWRRKRNWKRCCYAHIQHTMHAGILFVLFELSTYNHIQNHYMPENEQKKQKKPAYAAISVVINFFNRIHILRLPCRELTVGSACRHVCLFMLYVIMLLWGCMPIKLLPESAYQRNCWFMSSVQPYAMNRTSGSKNRKQCPPPCCSIYAHTVKCRSKPEVVASVQKSAWRFMLGWFIYVQMSVKSEKRNANWFNCFCRRANTKRPLVNVQVWVSFPPVVHGVVCSWRKRNAAPQVCCLKQWETGAATERMVGVLLYISGGC